MGSGEDGVYGWVERTQASDIIKILTSASPASPCMLRLPEPGCLCKEVAGKDEKCRSGTTLQ